MAEQPSMSIKVPGLEVHSGGRYHLKSTVALEELRRDFRRLQSRARSSRRAGRRRRCLVLKETAVKVQVQSRRLDTTTFRGTEFQNYRVGSGLKESPQWDETQFGGSCEGPRKERAGRAVSPYFRPDTWEGRGEGRRVGWKESQAASRSTKVWGRPQGPGATVNC